MSGKLNNPKYLALIEASKALFWKHGVRRVSVEEICKSAAVSKMTFYKFFPNKADLAKHILEELLNESIEKFDTLAKSDMPFSKKIEGMFLMKIQATNQFSMEFINDIYGFPELGLKTFLDEKSASFQQQVYDFYVDAQNKGCIRKSVKIDFIMAASNQLTPLMEDAKLMAKYDKPIDFILEIMNLLFYGFLTKDND